MGTGNPITRALAAKPKKPVRPVHLPHGRWLGDFKPLSDAETMLVRHCAEGTPCILGDGARPEQPEPARTVRAQVIRFLLLGGDEQHPIHESGVQLGGAWIDGLLDLDDSRVTSVLKLSRCGFSDGITAIAAKARGIRLSGSRLTTIAADRIHTEGGIFLDDDFHATEEVRLLGAVIEGNLICRGGSFGKCGEDGAALGDALSADGIVVKGDVFIDKGFQACGSVRFLGAHIEGDLVCNDATLSNLDTNKTPIGTTLHADRMRVDGSVFFNDSSSHGEARLVGAQIGSNLAIMRTSLSIRDANGKEVGNALSADRIVVKGGAFLECRSDGEVRFLGAHIGGNFSLTDSTLVSVEKRAFNADNLSVSGALFLRRAKLVGIVDLHSANVGILGDDLTCWNDSMIIMDGFKYRQIGAAPTDAKFRIEWLRRQISQHLVEDFAPQPWEQLIKVLRDMGHPYEASKIAMEKQRQWRKSWQLPLWRPRRWLNRLYGGLAGYGYRPWWTVGWMTLACCFCSLIYYEGRHDGLFGPTSAPIQLSKSLEICGDGGTPGKIAWTSPDCPLPPEYTSFQPFWYSLDVLLPFVDLGQEHDWAPITGDEKGRQLLSGHLLRILIWLEILFGWITGVLLAAVAGNLVKKD